LPFNQLLPLSLPITNTAFNSLIYVGFYLIEPNGTTFALKLLRQQSETDGVRLVDWLLIFGKAD